MFRFTLPWSDFHERQRRKKKTGKRTRFFLKKTAWLVFAAFLLNIVIILFLRWVPVPFSAFMVRHVLDGHTIAYRWVPWDHICADVAMAVIAAEDQKFPYHWGFDVDAIVQAMEENRTRTAPRGASTISQQVAKNLFFWPGRSWLRKGLEAYQTLWIELLWPKKRILEVYLNIAELGPGIFGVAEASRGYFQKPASRLTAHQSALLAAVLPNPHQLKVRQPSPYLRKRAAHIQRQVTLLGGVRYLSALDR